MQRSAGWPARRSPARDLQSKLVAVYTCSADVVCMDMHTFEKCWACMYQPRSWARYLGPRPAVKLQVKAEYVLSFIAKFPDAHPDMHVHSSRAAAPEGAARPVIGWS